MNSLQKRTLLILFWAFQFSVVVYYLLGYMMVNSPNARRSDISPTSPTVLHQGAPPPMPTLCYTLAGVCLVVGAVWGLTRLRWEGSAARFQTAMILGLAFTQAAMVFGLMLFFLGGSLQGLVPFAILTLAVNLLVYLPRVLRGSSGW